MSANAPPESSIILYQTADGRTRIECRFESDTIWLTQALIAELFQKDVRTISEHVVNMFEDDELRRNSTIRKFRMVRLEGTREVAREVEHYSLGAQSHDLWVFGSTLSWTSQPLSNGHAPDEARTSGSSSKRRFPPPWLEDSDRTC